MKTVLIGAVLLCFLQSPVHGSAPVQDTDWVKRSNAEAEPILKVMAKYSPEGAGQYGLDGYDEAVIDLLPGVHERHRADARELLARLEERLKKEQHPKVKQDMEILVQVLNDSLSRGDVTHRLLIPYFNVPEIVFNGIRALLNPNIAESRRAAAVIRLKKYAGLIAGTKPIAELAKEQTTERFNIPGLIGPYRVELQKDLK